MPQFLSIDQNKYAIVPVIASFNTDGKIQPLYVGIKGEQYKVLESYATKNGLHITNFQIKVISNDAQIPLTLSYYSNESVWIIPKTQIGK